METNENLLDLVVLLWKKRKPILIASILTAVITALISLMLPNYYQASTLFYAASPDLAKPAPLGNSESDIKIYGNDHDIDRLLSISKSSEIKEYLIREFDLFNHYEIKPDSKHAKHKLLLKLNKLFEVKKTKLDAISLSIEDVDIDKSALMANAARDQVELISRRMIKENHSKLIQSYQANIKAKEVQLNSLKDSLYNTRVKFKVFNTASQGEAFGSTMVGLEGKIQNTKAQISFLKNTSAPKDSILILQAKLGGFESQLSGLKGDIQMYNNGYPAIITLERDIKNSTEQLAQDRERLKQLEAAFNSDFNTIHIIEKAEKPVYKSRPKRSIIVIGLAGLMFVLSCFWFILMEQFKDYPFKEALKNE